MALLKTISGTRGTIGGRVGANLTAQDIVESTAAYAQWLLNKKQTAAVVVGRDARMSGAVVSELVCSTLRMMGIAVLDLGLSTTPTVEIAVQQEGAGGGIIITASHNPQEWNALKFLNHEGEFISGEDGEIILQLSAEGAIEYAPVERIGSYQKLVGYIQKHINLIMKLPLVQAKALQTRKFRVVIDCINSTGALSMVPLLEQLGCEVIAINDDVHGRFAHNPEPLPQHLVELSQAVVQHRADLGIAVDPDVDRLALVCEDGEMFGEEYTLVAIADYVLGHYKGNTVSNLSSTQALQVITERHGGKYHAAAVGEVNVVRKMKQVQAVIGGEGNGGVIYPILHYGRDAMVGIALFLSYMLQERKPASHLRRLLPNYHIVKDKIQLTPNIDIPRLLEHLKQKYRVYPKNTEDGLKIFVDDNWVHLRPSNTEPIVRIYAESNFEVTALNLVAKIKSDVKEFLAEG